MKDFKDKVAVITGGGSGIGEGLATELSRAGAHIVIADVAPDRVERAACRLRELTDGRVLGVTTDVSDQASVNALADAAYAEFGKVNLLFNNVGTSSVGTSWGTPLADWHRVLNVNLFGCVHGIQAFVPRMIAGGEEGYVVNTSSMAGLGPVPLKAPYTASKYGIVGLSRTLAGELQAAKARIGVSVVCPGPVATSMVSDSIEVLAAQGLGMAERELLVSLRNLCDQGISGEQAGEIIVDAIRNDRFWVLPNAGEFQAGVEDAHHALMREGFGRA
jgi:NAD(P)-dependent dehydrogenase (short-subunit alcohol dehydrogenase family)